MKRNLGFDNVKTQNQKFLEKMHKVTNKMENGLKSKSQSFLDNTFASPRDIHGNHFQEDILISKMNIIKDKENRINITNDDGIISK